MADAWKRPTLPIKGISLWAKILHLPDPVLESDISFFYRLQQYFSLHLYEKQNVIPIYRYVETSQEMPFVKSAYFHDKGMHVLRQISTIKAVENYVAQFEVSVPRKIDN